MNKKTVVIGASTNPDRYAHQAVKRLQNAGHEVIALGKRKGMINETEIITDHPQLSDVHTVTLYIRPEIQKELYDYILSLKPKRIIFNPGTENHEFEAKCNSRGIETTEACTLVMLSIGAY